MATRSGIQSRFGVRSLIACCILLCPVEGCNKSVKMPLASDASTSSASGTCSDYELNNEEEHVDCGGPNCMSCGVLKKSCKALLQMNPGIASDVQMLNPDGNGPEPTYTTFCKMSVDEGGWTLAMKLDGSKTPFA